MRKATEKIYQTQKSMLLDSKDEYLYSIIANEMPNYTTTDIEECLWDEFSDIAEDTNEKEMSAACKAVADKLNKDIKAMQAKFAAFHATLANGI